MRSDSSATQKKGPARFCMSLLAVKRSVLFTHRSRGGLTTHGAPGQ
ncbi:unnamed protein product [Staurois parvus]|uniref:Uncharacterized protein n=1 Tax=Staurois parvus TaxID=386267 RepID=A0ABN9HA76_9NEOB|nr:unnamed protein product [Staurois parvus]